MIWEIPLINRVKTKHVKIFLFAIIISLAVSSIDIISMNSGIFGNVENYTNGNFGVNWWDLFFKINLLFIGLFGLFYYFFSHKDFSESISLIMSSVIIWFGGLSDIMFFIIQGKAIPLVLNHLNNSLVIGNISKFFGFPYVTNVSLIISTILSLTFVFYLNKFLVKKL